MIATLNTWMGLFLGLYKAFYCNPINSFNGFCSIILFPFGHFNSTNILASKFDLRKKNCVLSLPLRNRSSEESISVIATGLTLYYFNNNIEFPFIFFQLSHSIFIRFLNFYPWLIVFSKNCAVFIWCGSIVKIYFTFIQPHLLY